MTMLVTTDVDENNPNFFQIAWLLAYIGPKIEDFL